MIYAARRAALDSHILHLIAIAAGERSDDGQDHCQIQPLVS